MFLSQQEESTSQRANEVDLNSKEHCCSASSRNHVFVGCNQPEALGPADSEESDDGDPIDGDLPDLQPINESDGAKDEDGSDGYVSDEDFEEYPDGADLVSALESLVEEVLLGCQPFPGDGPAVDPTYRDGDGRFLVTPTEPDILEVYDRVQGFETHISVTLLLREDFSVGRWFAERCAVNKNMPQPWRVAQEWYETRRGTRTTLWPPVFDENTEFFTREMTSDDALELGGVQVDKHKYPSLQRNSVQTKGIVVSDLNRW
jgi:hypothetical protein